MAVGHYSHNFLFAVAVSESWGTNFPASAAFPLFDVNPYVHKRKRGINERIYSRYLDSYPFSSHRADEFDVMRKKGMVILVSLRCAG